MNEKPGMGIIFHRALLDKLRALLAAVEWLGDARVGVLEHPPPDRADATVDLGLEGPRAHQLRVHVQKELRPGAFPAWAGRRQVAAQAAASPVLGMPSVSPRLADLCEEAGWSWFDLAGNCRIDVPGVLHMERSGMSPVWRASRPRANLSTAAAGRVLRALLSPGNACRVWRHRNLRDATTWPKVETSQWAVNRKPVSLGLVNKVVRHLRDEGFITGSRKEGFRVQDPMGLLTAWSHAYRFDLHERRSYFTLLRGHELGTRLYQVGLRAGGAAVYAAFSAAERQAAYVRQPRTWIYVSGAHLESMVELAQAKEVDSGETLVVLIPRDPGVFLSFESESYVGQESLTCTDPVQTYVDLLHCGGRGEEAARALLEQAILPVWKAGVQE